MTAYKPSMASHPGNLLAFFLIHQLHSGVGQVPLKPIVQVPPEYRLPTLRSHDNRGTKVIESPQLIHIIEDHDLGGWQVKQVGDPLTLGQELWLEKVRVVGEVGGGGEGGNIEGGGMQVRQER